jgi:type I restriction enzyme S subunit
MIALPDTNEQGTIADYLDEKCDLIDKTITRRNSFIERFLAYKKSLIYEIVTGKKEV